MKKKKTRNFACTSRTSKNCINDIWHFCKHSAPRLTPRNCSASHVGMILSFVIFITFTVFVYTLISPNINTAESKRTLLNEIGLSLIKNMSSEFTSLSVSITSSLNPNSDCITLDGILYYAEISPNVIVRNEGLDQQSAYYDPATDFNNLRINREDRENLFFKIYSSPEFEKIPETTVPHCPLINFGGGYEIGSLNSGKYIFQKNIILLLNSYEQDYNKLKTDLKISPGNEFSFEFTLSNGTKISAIEDLPTQNIYAEDIPVQYIDDEANILSGFINVKVW